MSSFELEEEEEDDALSKTDDGALLYDVLVHKEWPFQPESDAPSSGADPTSGGAHKAWKDWIRDWFAFWPGSAKASATLPVKVSSLLNIRSPWKIAISNDGSLLAVLEDNLLELFQREHFQTPVAKIRLNKDPLPTFRQLCWSPDSSLLAVTSSNGHIDLYDCNGYHVYQIFSQGMLKQEGQTPEPKCYAGLFFSTTRVKSRDWVIELMVIDYQGRIISFLLSPSGYQDYTSFTIPGNGVITAATLCNEYGLLCIAGQGNPSETSGPSKYGLSMWRLLGEPPYYDWVPPYDQNVPVSNQRFLLSGYLYGNSKNQDHIYLIELSPNGRELCCAHTSGDLSVWQVPSLRPVVHLPLIDQPSYDELNPSLLQNPRYKKRKKQFLRHQHKWMPLCIKWWDDKSIALVRLSGGVSILTTDSQKNILGDSPEFFTGATVLTQPFNCGFFILECEKTSSKKMEVSESFNDEDCTDGPSFNEFSSEEEEDYEELSASQRGKKLAKHIAYTLTESERFAPPRKKAKLMMCGYKLLSLTSTTPKELFARKIEMEEYGEALILAQHYQLDSDQVYMRQWKTSNLSVTAITDYLSKVKKRTLVLHECLTTVPPESDAIRRLLEYGLQETDCDIISADGDDIARFISEKTYESNPTYLTDEELEAIAKQRENELLSKVNWQSLNIFQKDILIQRRTLLKYLNRLEGYLSMLEEESFHNKSRDTPRFDPILYVKFRDQPILKSAIEFARQGKIGSVSSLLDNYPDQLNIYVLGILCNIPESLSPDAYSHLIPLKSADKLNQTRTGKKKDWSDFPFIMRSIDTNPSVDSHEELDSIKKCLPSEFIMENSFSNQLLSKWFNHRARIIYDRTGLVDHSLKLLHWAEVNEIQIDRILQHSFMTLDSMVFTLQQPCIMKIKTLENMSHLEVALKLIIDATPRNFMELFHSILAPFLERLETVETGSRSTVLKNFILHLATTSLELPMVFLKAILSEGTSSFLPFSNDDCIELGIQCIYGYDGEEDQIDIISDLAVFLRSKSQNPVLREDLSEILDVMRSIKLVKKYNINKSLQFFSSSKTNEKCMKDLCAQIARRAEGKKPRLNAQEWSGVLEDLFEFRRLCPLIVTEWFCLETLCNSLLCSESKENIKLVHDVFSHSLADVLFKNTNKSSPMLYILSMYKVGPVPKDEQKKIILDACKFYFDSCRDVADPNLEYVREILKLLPQEVKSDKDLEPTINFLMALDMLQEFGVSILPIVLRSAENQINVVQKILSTDKQAYKNIRKILKLIRLLGSCVNDESTILSTVADFAIRADDFEACLTICDILMATHPTSEAASRIAAQLVQQDKFENLEAKGRLSSFCVTYCSEELLESMLAMRREIFCSHMEEDREEVAEHEFRFEDIAAQPVALVKAAAETTTRVLPESGSRAISSLWGKFSKFTPVLQGVTGESKTESTDSWKLEKVVDAAVSTDISSKHLPQIVVDPFYERCFQGCKIGRLMVCFEGYALRTNDASVDETTLKLLRRHYENSMKLRQHQDEIDWTILKDIIINLLVNEDLVVGMSLLLTEFFHRDATQIQEVLSDNRLQHFILPLASLIAVAEKMQERAFEINTGQLYVLARSMHLEKKINSKIFVGALKAAGVEDMEETAE